jgi:DAK2 domain fusion protein YloV
VDPGQEVAAIDVLDPSAVRRWCAGSVAALAARRAEIDDLNVFPVADRDTGTNLLLTLRAADDVVRSDPPGDLAVTVTSMARGAVLGAQGNSGVIASQILRGIAEVLAAAPDGGPAAVATALGRGADLAWKAVGDPVEGTMLSVVRAAAGAAAEAAGGPGGGLAEVVGAAVRAAADALDRTPAQLPVLAEAGVVDAGGRGVLVLLEALAGVVTDLPVPPAGGPRPVRTVPDRGRLEAVRESGSDAYDYEVQYLLAAPADAVAVLREELTGLGDSLVVVGTGEGRWTVHVHVNDVGAAVEAGVRAGRPHRITVTRFADAVAAERREAVALVAVAPAPGVAELFAAEGVVVVSGPPTAGAPGDGRPADAPPAAGMPTAEQVLAAVTGTGAAAVVVLPGCSEVAGTCAAAAGQARAAGVEVAVVPIRAAVQGLAAVAVHDETRRFGDDVIAMAEAAAATRFAEVLVATRDGLTMAGPCRAGDVLGLVDGDVAVIGQSPMAVAGELLARMLNGGGELVTLVLGAGAAEERMARELERQVAASHPGVEVAVHTVARPDVPVLIGVE